MYEASSEKNGLAACFNNKATTTPQTTQDVASSAEQKVNLSLLFTEDFLILLRDEKHVKLISD